MIWHFHCALNMLATISEGLGRNHPAVLGPSHLLLWEQEILILRKAPCSSPFLLSVYIYVHCMTHASGVPSGSKLNKLTCVYKIIRRKVVGGSREAEKRRVSIRISALWVTFLSVLQKQKALPHILYILLFLSAVTSSVNTSEPRIFLHQPNDGLLHSIDILISPVTLYW